MAESRGQRKGMGRMDEYFVSATSESNHRDAVPPFMSYRHTSEGGIGHGEVCSVGLPARAYARKLNHQLQRQPRADFPLIQGGSQTIHEVNPLSSVNLESEEPPDSVLYFKRKP